MMKFRRWQTEKCMYVVFFVFFFCFVKYEIRIRLCIIIYSAAAAMSVEKGRFLLPLEYARMRYITGNEYTLGITE